MFRALPKHCFVPILAKTSAPQAKFLGTFWKILTKKSRFLGARSTSKLVYIGGEGAFRKSLGSITKNGYLKIVQRGRPFGSAGGRIPEGEGGRPHPKSAPDYDVDEIIRELIVVVRFKFYG